MWKRREGRTCENREKWCKKGGKKEGEKVWKRREQSGKIV